MCILVVILVFSSSTLLIEGKAYENEETTEINRLVISKLQATPIQCISKCEMNKDCRESGMLHNHLRGTKECILLGHSKASVPLLHGESLFLHTTVPQFKVSCKPLLHNVPVKTKIGLTLGVDCFKDENGAMFIEFDHDKKDETYCKGHSDVDPQLVPIHYYLTWAMILEAVEKSSSCKQDIKIRSSHSVIGDSRFIDKKNRNVRFTNSVCKGCKNLFNDGGQASGVGCVDDKDLLPLKGARIGDTDDSTEYAYIAFGKLVCQES